MGERVAERPSNGSYVRSADAYVGDDFRLVRDHDRVRIQFAGMFQWRSCWLGYCCRGHLAQVGLSRQRGGESSQLTAITMRWTLRRPPHLNSHLQHDAEDE